MQYLLPELSIRIPTAYDIHPHLVPSLPRLLDDGQHLFLHPFELPLGVLPGTDLHPFERRREQRIGGR